MPEKIADTDRYSATYDYSNISTAGITLRRKSDGKTKLLLGYSPNNIYDIVQRRRCDGAQTRCEVLDQFCDEKFAEQGE